MRNDASGRGQIRKQYFEGWVTGFAKPACIPVCKLVALCKRNDDRLANRFANGFAYRSLCVNALAIGMTTGLQSIWPLIGWLYINGLDVTCWLYWILLLLLFIYYLLVIIYYLFIFIIYLYIIYLLIIYLFIICYIYIYILERVDLFHLQAADTAS